MGTSYTIYYGLVPGLVYEAGRGTGRAIEGNRTHFTQNFIAQSRDLESDFLEILTSLINGDPTLVPSQLHALLDSDCSRGDAKVRWIPFHLSYVMSTLGGLAKFPFCWSCQGHRCTLREPQRSQTESWRWMGGHFCSLPSSSQSYRQP